MLPLLLTFLATLYLYAPGLVFRWAVGLAVGRENLKQPPSKVEETTQALVWIAIPLAITWLWVACSHSLRGSGALTSLEALFTGLYSESSFRAAPQQFYANVWMFLKANTHVLWRLYSLVLFYAAFTYVVLRSNRWLYERAWGKPLLRIALVTSPPLAEWFIWLSGIFVPRFLEIHADVLTKTGGLYQGCVGSYSLESSGGLRTLTLEGPRRFRREEYHEEIRITETPSSKFWRDIPGNLFVIQGNDIANVNLRYARRKKLVERLDRLDSEVLRELLGAERS